MTTDKDRDSIKKRHLNLFIGDKRKGIFYYMNNGYVQKPELFQQWFTNVYFDLVFCKIRIKITDMMSCEVKSSVNK